MEIIPQPSHILIQCGAFLIVLLVMSQWIFKPILNILDERQKRMTGDREEARELVKQAEAKIQEYEEKIYAAKSDAKDLKMKIVNEGVQQEREILNQARNDATETISDARDRLRKEAAQLMPQLKKDAQSLAQEMATIVLGRKV